MLLDYAAIMWVLVGVCFYAALTHLQIGLRRPIERLHVSFGVLCLFAGSATMAGVRISGATTSGSYIAAAWHSTFAVTLFFALFPWFIRDYILQSARWPAALICCAYVIVLAGNVFLPYSMLLSGPPLRGAVTAPHPWLQALWFAHLSTLAYLTWAIYEAFRRGPAANAWGLAISTVPFALTLVVNLLIGFGLIESDIYVGPFGFLAMILSMSVVLSDAWRRMSKQMQAVLDNVPAIAYLKLSDGTYVFVNRRFEQLYRIEGRPILGKTDIDFFDSTRAEQRRLADQQALTSGLPTETEESILCDVMPQNSGTHRGQETRSYLSLRFPLLDGRGKAYAVCGISTDITERKLAADSLRDLAATLERRAARRTNELSQLNRELEAFAYSVSHDLRAPLTTVNGFAELLLREQASKLDQNATRYLHRIRDGSLRMASLIQDLLGLSRVTQQSIERVSTDLTPMIEVTLKTLRETDPARVVTVTVPKSLPANGDPRLLALALNNLLANAWKYTSKTTDAHIEINTFEQGGETVYYVKDNGAGFNPDYTERLFRPFVRLHAESEFPGTGIGLATVARIVGKHGGRIWAEGKPLAGATFFFTLPPSEEELHAQTTVTDAANSW